MAASVTYKNVSVSLTDVVPTVIILHPVTGSVWSRGISRLSKYHAPAPGEEPWSEKYSADCIEAIEAVMETGEGELFGDDPEGHRIEVQNRRAYVCKGGSFVRLTVEDTRCMLAALVCFARYWMLYEAGGALFRVELEDGDEYCDQQIKRRRTGV